MVAVDGDGNPVHDALLWNDIRSDPQATRMIEEHGIQWWMDQVGMAPARP